MELPAPLSNLLRENFLFPGEEAAAMQLVEHTPSPLTSGKFSPPNPNFVKLQLSRNVKTSTLETLIHEINDFVHPIEDHINVLVYFKLHPSKVFSAYLHKEVDAQVLQVQEPGQDLEEEGQERLPVNISILSTALVHMEALIRQIMNGNATYREVVGGGLLNVRFADPRFDVEEEIQNFVKCPRFANYGTDGPYIVKCLLKLHQLPRYVKMIKCVCEQYHLEQCQEDSDFKQVSKWAAELEKEDEREKITSAMAKPRWENVEKIFCLKEGGSLKCLDLFSKIADSADFYHFLEEKQFTGRKGEELFRQQFELVTAQLQHEEYNETVLNHLFAAFRFISPFTDSGQSFSSLMKAVTSLDTTKGLTELDTVKNNMHLISLWFSRAEVSPNNTLVCIYLSSVCTYL